MCYYQIVYHVYASGLQFSIRRSVEIDFFQFYIVNATDRIYNNSIGPTFYSLSNYRKLGCFWSTFDCFKSRELIIMLIYVSSECSHNR